MNPLISAELAALRIAEQTSPSRRRGRVGPTTVTVFRRTPGR
jgi:hypothetical protein